MLEAPHGDEALRMLEHNGASIHLLVTDLVMPRLGGVDLARCVASRQPGVKVLFMSGYSDDALIRREGVLTGTSFFESPLPLKPCAGRSERSSISLRRAN